MLVARAVGLAAAAQALAQVARGRRRQGVIVVLVVGHQRLPCRPHEGARTAVTAAHATPAAEAAGGEVQGNYLPGVVVVVVELLPGVVEVVLLGVELELLLPGVVELLLPAPDVVSVVVEPDIEPEAEPEVLGVVVELLLLVSDGVVVVVDVPGVVVVVVDELLGVEPELPVLPLLQPVAATEARAMTATSGIRRFMTSSPIRFTCVEEMLWPVILWIRRTSHATACPEETTPNTMEFDGFRYPGGKSPPATALIHKARLHRLGARWMPIWPRGSADAGEKSASRLYHRRKRVHASR